MTREMRLRLFPKIAEFLKNIEVSSRDNLVCLDYTPTSYWKSRKATPTKLADGLNDPKMDDAK